MEERWVPFFLGMLKRMEYLGGIGSSRNVILFSDGDGDFRPKFTFDPKALVEKGTIAKDGTAFYDAG
jgi:hypothetical protein